MQFEFATAGRILFGPGKVREVAPAAAGFGHRALFVTNVPESVSRGLVQALEQQGLEVILYAIQGEPTIEQVRDGTQLARTAGCELVVGFGGGSAIDAGKAIAALLGNDGDPLDYLEVIGRGRPLTRPSVPMIAVPTTAGTGAEVTRNAVLSSPEHGVKASLRSPLMLPRLAVVDPELTYSLPRPITAATGLDALTQLIEPYVSSRANPFTDLFCLEGVRRAGRALPRLARDLGDSEARIDMAFASLLGGLALANAGLGAVHGFAAPIGGRFHAPHGAVCAILLPHVVEVNVRALRQRAPGHPSLERYRRLACEVTGNPQAEPADLVAWVQQLCEEFAIPRLASYGVQPADVAGLVEQAQQAASMKGNPIALSPNELEEILRRAL